MPDIPKKSRFRSTAEIRAEQRDVTLSDQKPIPKTEPERTIDLLLMELKVYGFACVKEIARLCKQTSGTMDCPMCGQSLKFSIVPTNGHCHAKCSREGCIRIME